MQVKTFEAFSMKEAIRAVRAEFGPEAVILKTREKAVEGGASGKVVEVTAAVPVESRAAYASARPFESGGEALSVIEAKLQLVERKVGQISETMVTRDALMGLEAGFQELKLMLAAALRDRDGSAFKGLDPALSALVRKLTIMGIDEARLGELVKYLANVPAAKGDKLKVVEDDPSEAYQLQAIRWMLKRLKIAPKWAVVPETTSVHVFIGATGVGKSATVAKLAAHYKMKEKKKVLIVTVDNSRLAAAEQMRIYAKVIGVPFETIEDGSELAPLLGKYRDTDLILIDTAGRSPKSGEKMADLAPLKSLAVPVDFHLVLSLTEKDDQLDRTVRSFSKLGIQSLIFTKLDETWSYGEIFNLCSRWSLPLSYFGTGQKIPEHIERATRERVVERIFGL